MKGMWGPANSLLCGIQTVGIRSAGPESREKPLNILWGGEESSRAIPGQQKRLEVGGGKIKRRGKKRYSNGLN